MTSRASITDHEPSLVSSARSLAGRASARPARPSAGWRKRLELMLFLGPPLVLFVGFVLVPIVVAAYYSLFNWNGFGARTFTGLENYWLVVTGTVFQQSVVHNVLFVFLAIIVQTPLSIGLALLLNRRLRGRRVLRLVVFAPYVLSEAIAAVMWLLLLQPGGFVDQAMRTVGMGGLVRLWLGDTSIVLFTLFVVLTWKYIGFGIILLLAGLQGIPEELREAASLDGASPWQSTRFLIIPLLGPTIRILIFINVIGSLQLFDIVWIMTKGGPANASMTMATYLIDHGFQSYEFGYGSAVAVILFLICFVFALFYQRYALRRDTDGALTRMVG